MRKKNAKIVLLGNSNSGRHSLLNTYISGIFDESIPLPTVYEQYSKQKDIDGEPYSLSLWTVGAYDEYARLRPLCYPNTTCILLCYSIDRRDAYESIKTDWIVEVKHFMPDIPFILVGTKSDLREVEGSSLKLVSVNKGEKLAREIRAECYLECSAKRLTTFDDILVEAVRAGNKQRKKDNKRKCVCV